MKKILIVATSHRQLGSTGQPTGLWLDEFAAPFQKFRDAGYAITVASPQGGPIPVDPKSLTPETMGAAALQLQRESDPILENTRRLSEIDGREFSAVFYPGGHGPMWDLAEDPANAALLTGLYDSGKVIGAVCHGPAALLRAVHDDKPLIADKRLTGFSNAEEQAVHLETIVPFLLEDALKARGARYSAARPWTVHVITDGNLVTGQNPQSAEAVAEAMLRLLA